MIPNKDKRTVKIILIIFAVVVLAYIAQDLYFGYTGPVQTEKLYPVKDHQIVSVQGFAVRDENRTQNGKNISILSLRSDKVYIPTVSDSASVAVGDPIAVQFDTQEQAQLYTRARAYEKKINDLEQLQNLENPTLVNAATLNTDISNAWNNYLEQVESGNYSGLDAAQSRLTVKITTRLLAAGGNLKVASRIEKYAQKKAQIEKKINTKSFVTSPYAGYFISRIDGYEGAYDYQSLVNGKIKISEIENLLKSEPVVPESAVGKIIGQNTWFFVCNMTLTDASNLKKGHEVTVDFPKENLFDIPMQVHAVSERTDNTVAVIFQCTQMNEAISALRLETAEITINTYEGFRISNELLRKNDDGLTGVYVLAGKRVQFKPIRILYHGNGYVIAAPAVYYLENGEVDTEQTPAMQQIENYDQLIVKGKNLYDGKVIS
ncbi:MAG: hypothetical protein IJU56_06135 [Clostridia bacterium]|nr:hypothetical protein [Clostridia bacterium]